MHIIGKKKTLGQGLGNTATLAFLPHPHTGGRRQRLAVQQELGLPRWSRLGGGRNPRTNLGLRLTDNDPPCWLGRSLDGSISQARGWLIGDPLFLWARPAREEGGG